MTDLPREAVEAMGKLTNASSFHAEENLTKLTASGHVQAFTREELEAMVRLMEAPMTKESVPTHRAESPARRKARAALDAMNREGS